MTNQSLLPTAGFRALGIAPAILEILAQRNVSIPTPIQHQSIPPAIDGKDVVGIAQTGTGKTFAYGIPLVQNLARGKTRGLVVVPTRELAEQVDAALSIFTRPLGLRTAVLIGGASAGRQREMIRRNPHIVIATPGRLNDHLEQRTITLREVSMLVLDEADRMLDMGFRPQIERILRHVPRERQTLLFSATMPHEIMRLAGAHMKLPIRVEVAPSGTTAAKIEQELFIVPREEKLRLLENILGETRGSVLVFSRTKHGARKITRALKAAGMRAAEIHANRSLKQRREALDAFKRGAVRVLVATDIASRGIDVTGIELVINFDLPDDPTDYVHRIGRTARADREGRAITFASADQKEGIRKIERLIRSSLRRSHLPTLRENRSRVEQTPALETPVFEAHQPRQPRFLHHSHRPHRRGRRQSR